MKTFVERENVTEEDFYNHDYGKELIIFCVITDIFLTLLLPCLILLHLLAAPYSKVEESFNLQATHDILVYSTPTHDIGRRLRTSYDHFEFPGAVPRTFVGAVVLAGISRPFVSLLSWGQEQQQHGQLIARAVLGLLNAVALLWYKHGLERAYGRGAGRWFIVLLASQFHVVYYASRTLPNMFAFGLSTLALREILPMSMSPLKPSTNIFANRHCMVIYLFVLAGIIFRAEIALLLATHVLYSLGQRFMSLQTVVSVGLRSAAVALAISVPIDSYFWQRPVWPELAGFIYNAIQGKSADWGTSPFHAYFTNFLPKLLLNPAIFLLLIPSAFYFRATVGAAFRLAMPSLVFVAIYSFQPHKEARFIIYAVPPLTACAALGANYIFTRRSKSLWNRMLSLAIIASVIGSFAASIVMLGISSLNYPGGEALFRLHEIVVQDEQIRSRGHVSVHMDVLSCMTGVSRFQQDSPSAPLSHHISSLFQPSNSTPTSTMTTAPLVRFQYDKTEASPLLLDPSFWSQFDYVLAEKPETVIGSWEIVETVYAYAGMEVLRPGDVSASGVDNGQQAERAWEAMGGKTDGRTEAAGDVEEQDMPDTKLQAWRSEVGRLGAYGAIREGLRKHVTRGWWAGPRMEARIRILRRVP